MEIVVQALSPTRHVDTAPASPRPAGSPESDLLTTTEAAPHVRLSPRTLEKYRVLGGGPKYKKLGARVFYSSSDLKAWLESRTFEMTSDPGLTQRACVR
jgi:predicted DNA-binding transcriptional regulator AlpA